MRSSISSTHPFVSFIHCLINLSLRCQLIQCQLKPFNINSTAQQLGVSSMTSPTSSPIYPGPAHLPEIKPPGYAEATRLEAQPNDADASLPIYSPLRPCEPWPGQSEAALFNVERTVRRARLRKPKNRSLACFFLLAFLLLAVFIVVLIIEVVGHLDLGN